MTGFSKRSWSSVWTLLFQADSNLKQKITRTKQFSERRESSLGIFPASSLMQYSRELSTGALTRKVLMKNSIHDKQTL